MFDDVQGMSAREAAYLTAMVERCRPVLAAEGMEAVQQLLVEQGVAMIRSIAITRALLGWRETPLPTAVDIVGMSKARNPPT